MIIADQAWTTYDVCSIPIAALTPHDASRVIIDYATRGKTLEVHLCNAYTLSLVDQDESLRHALRRSHLNLPDGTPVARIGRGSGTIGPVRGPGLVGDVVSAGREAGIRHYYFGAGPGVADQMAARLEESFPGALTAGTESPAYGPLDDQAVEVAAGRIRDSRADIVWVGLGTPRQDYLVPRLAEHLDMPIIPVGAAFDFWAGNVAEAPRWMHGSGLEWLHRLGSEPRRLWRRYLIGNPRFLVTHVRHSVSSR